MNTKSFTATAATLALAAGLATSAWAGPQGRTFSVSFTSIGDAPAIEWTPYTDTIHNPGAHFGGQVQAVDTGGVANMLVNYDGDAALDALGDLESTIVVQGYYRSYLDKQYTALHVNLFYAGNDPFTLDGIDYARGARLLSFHINDYYYDFATLGPSFFGGPSTGLAGVAYSNTSVGALNWEGTPPTKVTDPDLPARTYIQAGQGRWSGYLVGSFTPEPATWALMIGGFAAVGANLRRRHWLDPAASIAGFTQRHDDAGTVTPFKRPKAPVA